MVTNLMMLMVVATTVEEWRNIRVDGDYKGGGGNYGGRDGSWKDDGLLDFGKEKYKILNKDYRIVVIVVEMATITEVYEWVPHPYRQQTTIAFLHCVRDCLLLNSASVVYEWALSC